MCNTQPHNAGEHLDCDFAWRHHRATPVARVQSPRVVLDRQSHNATADYHIDFPIYYFQEDWNHPRLAVKDEDLQESDPKEVVDWFIAAKDKNGQLVRVVKYLKGWGDFKRNKMPSGLAMCILTEENIKYNDRDDVCVKDTLEAIKESLDENFECIVQGTPFDDLFCYLL